MSIICQSCLGNKMIKGFGDIPADVLFIGEKPKPSEVQIQWLLTDRIRDFIDELIIRSGNRFVEYYYTNMIMCAIPEITDDSVLECKHNLINIFKEVKPKVVIFLSKEVETYYKKEFKNHITILHPEYLLRTGGAKSPFYLPTITKMKGIKYYVN